NVRASTLVPWKGLYAGVGETPRARGRRVTLSSLTCRSLFLFGGQSVELESWNDGDGAFALHIAPLFKARPATEGKERFLYIEPPNENLDDEQERVLQTTLAKALPGYLRDGNVDIAHLSILPKLAREQGIEHPELMEVGRPVKGIIEPRIMIKARIYS